MEWSAGVFKRPRISLFGCLVATAEVNLVNQLNTKHSNSPNNTSKSSGCAVTSVMFPAFSCFPASVFCMIVNFGVLARVSCNQPTSDRCNVWLRNCDHLWLFTFALSLVVWSKLFRLVVWPVFEHRCYRPKQYRHLVQTSSSNMRCGASFGIMRKDSQQSASREIQSEIALATPLLLNLHAHACTSGRHFELLIPDSPGCVD